LARRRIQTLTRVPRWTCSRRPRRRAGQRRRRAGKTTADIREVDIRNPLHFHIGYDVQYAALPLPWPRPLHRHPSQIKHRAGPLRQCRSGSLLVFTACGWCTLVYNLLLAVALWPELRLPRAHSPYERRAALLDDPADRRPPVSHIRYLVGLLPAGAQTCCCRCWRERERGRRLRAAVWRQLLLR
jgi:hypothetical protein